MTSKKAVPRDLVFLHAREKIWLFILTHLSFPAAVVTEDYGGTVSAV
jgi:hypothetical protein